MNFSEKLRAERKNAHLSQTKLAKMAEISLRTLQNYETGKRYPANMEISLRLAKALGLAATDLLSPAEESIVASPLPSAKKELQELVRRVSGLFSGGALEEEDRDAAMEAIIAAYWAAKRGDRSGNVKERQKR